MRITKAFSLFFVAALATTAFAEEGTLTAIPRPAGAPATIQEAVQQIQARSVRGARTGVRTRGARLSAKSRIAPARVAPNVIEYETADVAFIIPAAGNVQGANGTFFRSDVTIGNFLDTAQNIGVGWMEQGKDNSTVPLSFFSIPGNTIAALNDFVGQTLKKTGLGGLLIIAYNAAGTTPDNNAVLDGFSRIWTPQPGSTGTVSQSFPSVSLIDSVDDFTAFALGLRHDSAFRTNAGVVNLDTKVHTFTVTSMMTGATMTLTVQPFSLSQGGIPASFSGSGGNVGLMFDPDAPGFNWSAYGSSVDNVTGDGWVSRATQ